jgi:hypothetical protein
MNIDKPTPHLPTYLPIYLPTHPFIYIPIHLPTYLLQHAHLSTYEPTYFLFHISYNIFTFYLPSYNLPITYLIVL